MLRTSPKDTQSSDLGDHFGTTNRVCMIEALTTFADWKETRAHVQSLESGAALMMDEQDGSAFTQQWFDQLQQTRQRAEALFVQAAAALAAASAGL
jgi:hypothetical protein